MKTCLYDWGIWNPGAIKEGFITHTVPVAGSALDFSSKLVQIQNAGLDVITGFYLWKDGFIINAF